MPTPLPSSPSSADETWLDAESVDSEPVSRASAPSDALIGSTLLDAYVIDRVLGEGGMGRIYEAHHMRLPARRFAVKALRPELLTSPNVRARFEREVEAVSRITHPGVLSIADVGTTVHGVPFMVCEHLSGLDLLAYLRRFGPLSNERSVHMGCRIAEALEAAHAQGVIHRDIKPSNIFLLGAFEPLGPEWERVKLIDFGLSRVAGRDDQLTATGIVMGTPAYMSPEQARGARTDPRTDVYGVGAVLYAAATGVPPFREKTPQQTLLAVMGHEPVRPRELVSSISEGLELVIQRAMSKEPEHRYPSMSALRLALAQLELASPRVTGSAPSSTPAATSGVRTRFAALALGALALATGTVASLVRSARPQDDDWTPLERAALLALATTALLLVVRAALRFRARAWSNTATLSDALPRLRAPLFGGLLAYTLTSLALQLVGERLLGLARLHGPAWSRPFPPPDALPAATAVLVALGVAAHQTWWAPLRPLTRWLSAPALAAALAVAVFAPIHWRWLLEPDAAAPARHDEPAPPLAANAAAAGQPAADATRTGAASEGPAATALPALERSDAGAPAGPSEPRVADAGRLSPPFVRTDDALRPASRETPAARPTAPELAPPPTPPASKEDAVAPRPPGDESPAALEPELLAQARRLSDLPAALRAIDRLLALSPSAGADPDVRRTLRLAASAGGEPSRTAFRLMGAAMGSHGPDLLYQIMLAQPALADKAKFLLSRHRVRKLFSPELAIAYDLRFSPSCTARLGLLQRASEIGDQRSINTLAALMAPAPSCGQPNHSPCLEPCEREAPQFARAVDSIVRRIRGSERAASAN